MAWLRVCLTVTLSGKRNLSGMEEKINILIADDHPAVRYGIRSILQLEPNLNIIGEVSSGDEAIAKLASRHADLVIVDIKMPGKDGIETVRKLKKDHPSLKILAFSIFDDQYKVLRMLKAGANGYLLKSADSGEMVKAIAAIMRGEKYVSKELADKVIYNVVSGGNSMEEGTQEELSEREEEVLKMLTHDNSYAEIAKTLGISKRTVDTHRYNISKKLGIKSVAGLIRYAINHGLS